MIEFIRVYNKATYHIAEENKKIAEENKRITLELAEANEKLAGTAEKQVELQPNSGVFIAEKDLLNYQINTPSYQIFARSLFKHFFTVGELQTHSLYGI